MSKHVERIEVVSTQPADGHAATRQAHLVNSDGDPWQGGNGGPVGIGDVQGLQAALDTINSRLDALE